MSNAVAVTTFNRAGLEKYGKRMMQTFDKHWALDVPLHIYHEGFNPVELDYDTWNKDCNFAFKQLIVVSPWLMAFKKRNAQRNQDNGFRHDAIRFSHKVAALLHACVSTDADYVIWLDGDIVTHADFNEEDLDTLLPKDELIAWLDRRRMYPECGFYIINRRHALYPKFLEAMHAMYAGDKLFNLPEWHDSYVMQQVVVGLDAPTKSLSGEVGHASQHPLINGPLGQWFDHLKGKRKNFGKSHRYDLRVQRTEEYWSRKK
jgi:hypothetical protein